MKHLAMDVASWWITWVLFGLVAWGGLGLLLAWGGLGLLLVWAVHRFFCWQDRQPAPYLPTAKTNDALRCGCGDCLAAKPVNDIEWARLTRACWQGDSK